MIRRRGCLGLGCGVLVLGAIAAVIGLGVCGSLKAQCPPPDFPLPQGAHVTNYDVKIGPQGGTCRVTWLVDEMPVAADVFYGKRLSGGDWRTDPEPGPGISFHRASHPGIHGVVLFSPAGSRTRVEMRLQSDRYGFGR